MWKFFFITTVATVATVATAANNMNYEQFDEREKWKTINQRMYYVVLVCFVFLFLFNNRKRNIYVFYNNFFFLFQLFSMFIFAFSTIPTMMYSQWFVFSLLIITFACLILRYYGIFQESFGWLVAYIVFFITTGAAVVISLFSQYSPSYQDYGGCSEIYHISSTPFTDGLSQCQLLVRQL